MKKINLSLLLTLCVFFIVGFIRLINKNRLNDIITIVIGLVCIIIFVFLLIYKKKKDSKK